MVELALECQPSPLFVVAMLEARLMSCSRIEVSEWTRAKPASKATSVRLRRSFPRFDSGRKTERLCLQSCRHSGRFVLQCYAGSGAHTGQVKAVQIKSRKLELESLTTLEPG